MRLTRFRLNTGQDIKKIFALKYIYSTEDLYGVVKQIDVL